MAYIKLIFLISSLTVIHSLALSVKMISKFPHLLNKPFSIEIIRSSRTNNVTTDPSDTMVIRIIDKNLDEKQKHSFYCGGQDSINAEFKGQFMDILVKEKNKITLSILFKLISHDMFVELFALSASDKLHRRNISNEVNLTKYLLRQQINLFYPAKLNLSINSLNNNINNKYIIFPGDKVVATCIVSDGFPINKPIFTIPDQLNVTKTTYDMETYELKKYFLASINNHLQKLTCKSENTSESINVYITHHPTSIFIEPEIDKLVEPNTRLTCFVKDGYPAPEITWQLISGPRNASMYYSIISNGSQLDIKSNSPIKSSWTFKCSVKGYSMITERIISFHIAVHPSQLYVEPEIKKWLQSNSQMSCYIKDENLNPEIKWQLVEGPPNASLYYDILNNGSEIYMNTNNLPGTIWTFRCNVKIVLTTTKLLNKTISFVIAKNMKTNCNQRCINSRVTEVEEEIDETNKLHNEINRIKVLISQLSMNINSINETLQILTMNRKADINKLTASIEHKEGTINSNFRSEVNNLRSNLQSFIDRTDGQLKNINENIVIISEIVPYDSKKNIFWFGRKFYMINTYSETSQSFYWKDGISLQIKIGYGYTVDVYIRIINSNWSDRNIYLTFQCIVTARDNWIFANKNKILSKQVLYYSNDISYLIGSFQSFEVFSSRSDQSCTIECFSFNRR